MAHLKPENDPFHLNRFVEAQETSYPKAVSELQNGQKRSHWMWFIFPQCAGLGLSWNARYFAIGSLEEATSYLSHPILGPRLMECFEIVMGLEERSAEEIFGSTDETKLRSCATLFACVSEPDSVFDRLIEKYFGGEPDLETLELLEIQPRVTPQ